MRSWRSGAVLCLSLGLISPACVLGVCQLTSQPKFQRMPQPVRSQESHILPVQFLDRSDSPERPVVPSLRGVEQTAPLGLAMPAVEWQ